MNKIRNTILTIATCIILLFNTLALGKQDLYLSLDPTLPKVISILKQKGLSTEEIMNYLLERKFIRLLPDEIPEEMSRELFGFKLIKTSDEDYKEYVQLLTKDLDIFGKPPHQQFEKLVASAIDDERFLVTDLIIYPLDNGLGFALMAVEPLSNFQLIGKFAGKNVRPRGTTRGDRKAGDLDYHKQPLTIYRGTAPEDAVGYIASHDFGGVSNFMMFMPESISKYFKLGPSIDTKDIALANTHILNLLNARGHLSKYLVADNCQESFTPIGCSFEPQTHRCCPYSRSIKDSILLDRTGLLVPHDKYEIHNTPLAFTTITLLSKLADFKGIIINNDNEKPGVELTLEQVIEILKKAKVDDETNPAILYIGANDIPMHASVVPVKTGTSELKNLGQILHIYEEKLSAGKKRPRASLNSNNYFFMLSLEDLLKKVGSLKKCSSFDLNLVQFDKSTLSKGGSRQELSNLNNLPVFSKTPKGQETIGHIQKLYENLCEIIEVKDAPTPGWFTDDIINRVLDGRFFANLNQGRMHVTNVDDRDTFLRNLTQREQELKNHGERTGEFTPFLATILNLGLANDNINAPKIMGNHFVALLIVRPIVTGGKAIIFYIDPFGRAIPNNVRNAINTVYPNNKINFNTNVYQTDEHNCGPLSLAILRYVIEHDGELPPLEAINPAQARAEFLEGEVLDAAEKADLEIASKTVNGGMRNSSDVAGLQLPLNGLTPMSIEALLDLIRGASYPL